MISSKKTILESFFLHITLFIVLVFFIYTKPTRTEKTEFEVIVQPKQSPSEKEIKIEKIKPKIVIEKKSVFGLSNHTLKSDSIDSKSEIEVKAGNTINKEMDHDKSNDHDSLPIPSDEYLITEMPRLKNEIKIPYPEEAKKKGIEGAVVFELLIDTKGKVRDLTFIRGPGYGLNEAAEAAIKTFVFNPAKIKDTPVAVKIRYAYKFILQR